VNDGAYVREIGPQVPELYLSELENVPQPPRQLLGSVESEAFGVAWTRLSAEL